MREGATPSIPIYLGIASLKGEAISTLLEMDCFVAETAPRNDI